MLFRSILKDINLEDAIDIRELRNLKVANQLLKLKRIKNQEREERMAMQQQAMQQQGNLQSQQMAAQAALAKIEAETQGKIKVKQAEISFDISKMEREAQLKSQLMAEEFQYNMQITGKETESLNMRDDMKERAKDKRIKIQSTTQSELIHQRQNKLPPKNFESNEDSMDGFDLAEFEPR